jgi:hypothetical protein
MELRGAVLRNARGQALLSNIDKKFQNPSRHAPTLRVAADSNAPRIPPIQLESLLTHLEVMYYDCFLLSKNFSRFGLFGAVLGRFGGLLGRSWGILRQPGGSLNASWGDLGSLLGPLWATWGVSWCPLGRS